MDKKYLMILLGFFLSVALFVIIGVLGLVKIGPDLLIPKEYVTEFVFILPGPLITDILLLFAIPVVIYFLFYFLAPYFILVYIKLHKFIYWIMRRPSQYGIFRLGPTVKPGRLFIRAFVVSLFSFSISALIVQMGYGELFRAGWIDDIFHQAEAAFLGTFFLCAFMIILFFPVWLLEDSGVVSYRVFHAERMPVDIQGVHSIYSSILTGYAGLSTILALATYIIKTFHDTPLYDPRVILTPIILIVLPFIVTGLLAIPIALYEHFFFRNRERLYSKLAGFKFPEIRVPKFEELQLEK